ncbi:MarR family winged helix-turn-helix transcriptional regulator [Streptomyces sp. AC512_CC834]|uniref:MarR family winged helix-turn-helix transcriptional regulator n=1 Tax=Streptomyces sp. AC512_CC834 TaxID=2823691 RepID=UPI001C2574FD|nr:MarR family transcriptional regulator [Streptomyces sp. AC512_CC834]
MTPDDIPDAGTLRPEQLGTYFALMEAVSLLQRAVEQQLQTEGDLSYVQFQLLARLADAGQPLTMTDLADGVVYSRSGLTHQAGLLAKAGLITRGPSPQDQRATMVTLTDEGLARVGRVLPGHIDITRRLLFAPLTADDVDALGSIMTRVRNHMRQQPDSTARGRRTAPKHSRSAAPSE